VNARSAEGVTSITAQWRDLRHIKKMRHTLEGATPTPMVQVIRHQNLFMTALAAAVFGGWLMLT
jgi:hypothetical protein